MTLIAAILAVAGLAYGLADTDTITWGGDNSRTGYQTNHKMDPAIVGSSQFGQLFRIQLPGRYNGAPEQMFSQPLVYTPSGGDTQYLYLATTQNNVYKLNAKTGEIIASRNLHIPFLTAELDGCVDINPLIGITSTGVIDPATDTLYLTAKTYRDQDGGTGPQGRDEGRSYVHALDVNDLSERPNFPVDLEGTVARNNPSRVYGGGIQLQRPALLHAGNYIYAGFASHCVQYNFTGWIMGWDKTTGETVERWATEGAGVPNDVPGGGIWMSGGGLASDDSGSIFFATGNGYASQLAKVPVAGFDPPTALEEAAVHMTQNEDGSLDIVDFFMPWEKEALDGGDQDLGTSPLEILPSQFSCGDYKRIGVVTGKSGKTYWLNLDDLGGYRNGADGLDDVIQVYENLNSVYAGAGVYPLEGGYIYINVIQYPSNVFKFSCNNGKPAFTKVAETPVDNAYILGVGHGTVTSLDGEPGTGMLWITDREGENLRIYDAVPQDGTMRLLNSFKVPGSIKFGRPVFGDGIMYQTTDKGEVYGFGSPINMPLNCSGTVDFGDVDTKASSKTKQVTCHALIDIEITSIALGEEKDFALAKIPDVPLELEKGDEITIAAMFKPTTVGFLAADVVFNTTNGGQGFSTRSSTRLTGTGTSADALLFISPNTLTFKGAITGADPNGALGNVQITNRGNSPLVIKSIEYSVSGDGPYETWDGSGNLQVGKFTISDIPDEVAANSGATLDIRLDTSESGDFSGFVKIISNGGTKSFAMAGYAGPAPVAQVEFQTIDGDDWVAYKPGRPFTFGNVTENTSRSLRMRVTNNAPVGGVRLSLTVSKPPFGGSSIIRAANQVDLAEGTSLAPGQNATAVITCTSAKRQWNTDPKNGTATWTMNTNDLKFEKQVIQFYCNSVAEQAPPLLDDGEGKYRYIGCFKENNPGRQLDNQLYGDDDNTNAICIEACAKREYTFCGTQYTRECWGGNKIPALKVDEVNCNYACSGDIHQVCGGNGEGEGAGGAYFSLFADSLSWDGNLTRPDDGSDDGDGGDDGGNGPKPVVNPGVAGYTSLGCYTEATNGRALPHGEEPEIRAVQPCINACASKEYVYAGLEYGGECWCGDSLSRGAVRAPAAECNIACSGNRTELCGGGNRLNVYRLNDGTIPTGTPSPDPSSTSTGEPEEPTNTGPSKTPRVGEYHLQGCWTEAADGRALSAKTYADDDMTLDSCATYCDGNTYFGVEYGRECYCGNSLRDGSEKSDQQSDCNFPCPGDPSQYCGAGNRLELYKLEDPLSTETSSASRKATVTGQDEEATASDATSASTTRTSSTASATPTTPRIDSGNTNFTFYSCAHEPSEGRLFDLQVYNDGEDMTIDSCLERCWKYGWAGVEYGRECWCGDAVNWKGLEGATPGRNVSNSTCDMTCPGNEKIFCGGSSVMSLYVKKDDKHAEDNVDDIGDEGDDDDEA